MRKKLDYYTDDILVRIAKSKYSPLYVSGYTILVYMMGYYMGDVIHFVQNAT